MKKKYFVIAILLLSFIFIGEVNAANNNVILKPSNIRIAPSNATASTLVKQTNTSYFDFTPNNKNSSFYIYFDNIRIPNNTSYFTIPFTILNNNNDKYYSCSTEYSSSNEITQFDFTTTYADGTESTNEGSANTTSSYKYCSQFRSDNDEIALNITYKLTDNTSYNCHVIVNNNQFEAVCPVPNENGKWMTFMTFNIITNETNNYNSYNIRFSNFIYATIDSNAQMIEKQQETNNKLDNIDTSINSSNTSGGESAADDLKNNSAFQDNSGLSSVVSMPLTFVNSLSNTCQPISLNIPYFDVDMQIPCFQSIITEKMPALANIIKVVINGFIIYRVLLDIFQIIRNAKNPEDDRIEVLDL